MQASCLVACCGGGVTFFVSGGDYRSTEASSAVAYNRSPIWIDGFGLVFMFFAQPWAGPRDFRDESLAEKYES